MEHIVEYKTHNGWVLSAFTKGSTVQETYERVHKHQDPEMEYRIVVPVPPKESQVVVEVLLPTSGWGPSVDFPGPYTTIEEALVAMGQGNPELHYRLVQGDKVYSLIPPVYTGWSLAD